MTTVVVTGTARGLGMCLAEAYLKQGATVFGLDRLEQTPALSATAFKGTASSKSLRSSRSTMRFSSGDISGTIIRMRGPTERGSTGRGSSALSSRLVLKRAPVFVR